VHVVVLAGAGRNFSAGHDIGSPGRDVTKSWERRGLWYDHVDKPGAEAAWVREQEVYLGMCHRWRNLPKPTIAMVHGACIAGGLALAWICDICIASDDAFFQDPVLRMGIPGIEYFAHAFEMHPRIAREFVYTGMRISAQRASELGMINHVVPRERLVETTEELAGEIATKPRFALALAKQAFNQLDDLRGRRIGIDATFQAHHLAHAHNLLLTGDAIAGVRARDMQRDGGAGESEDGT
jgi:enoyl-CoA hydratase